MPEYRVNREGGLRSGCRAVWRACAWLFGLEAFKYDRDSTKTTVRHKHSKTDVILVRTSFTDYLSTTPVYTLVLTVAHPVKVKLPHCIWIQTVYQTQ